MKIYNIHFGLYTFFYTFLYKIHNGILFKQENVLANQNKPHQAVSIYGLLINYRYYMHLITTFQN